MAAERPVRVSPRAEADLANIFAYTTARWGIRQAQTYHAGFIAAFRNLAAGRAGVMPAVRIGYLKLRVGMHVIYLKDGPATIDVIRILHAAMDVDRHL
ncbi:type II toxin-antitoxin system RelE/ParE family toxin (plasmid) [Tistrella mobilis]|uniref:type II toxin-antitoxin system RelE/ParE family toxin n=1 Tax=Tistrella mobilis TaxID=171437 RepID=UPI003558FBBB